MSVYTALAKTAQVEGVVTKGCTDPYRQPTTAPRAVCEIGNLTWENTAYYRALPHMIMKAEGVVQKGSGPLCFDGILHQYHGVYCSWTLQLVDGDVRRCIEIRVWPHSRFQDRTLNAT